MSKHVMLKYSKEIGKATIIIFKLIRDNIGCINTFISIISFILNIFLYRIITKYNNEVLLVPVKQSIIKEMSEKVVATTKNATTAAPAAALATASAKVEKSPISILCRNKKRDVKNEETKVEEVVPKTEANVAAPKTEAVPVIPKTEANNTNVPAAFRMIATNNVSIIEESNIDNEELQNFINGII